MEASQSAIYGLPVAKKFVGDWKWNALIMAYGLLFLSTPGTLPGKLHRDVAL